jgi:repressor LexA
MTKLNIDAKLNEVLNFIKDFSARHGYPPSVREMCGGLRISSTASVYYYLNKLESLGLISKSPSKNRAIEIKTKYSDFAKKTSVDIPLLGKIAAGEPILAVENLEDVYPLPRELFGNGELFMLSIKGDSMIDAGIFDGDKIIIKKQPAANNGEIVAALIDGCATVKRLFVHKDKIVLHPENAAMQDIVAEKVDIIGVAAGLIRKI